MTTQVIILNPESNTHQVRVMRQGQQQVVLKPNEMGSVRLWGDAPLTIEEVAVEPPKQ